MSLTRAQVRENIRQLLNDTDDDDLVVDSWRLNALIQDGMNLIAQRVALPLQQDTAAVTLSAGVRDYNLPSLDGSGTLPLQYDRIAEVVRVSDNRPLTRVSLETIAAERWVDRSGAPELYALFESATQAISIRVAPTPAESDTLDIRFSNIPNRLNSESSSIAFSDPLLRGLEKHVAACVIKSARPEDLQRIGLNGDIAAVWYREVEIAIKQERVRQNRLRRLDRIERTAWQP